MMIELHKPVIEDHGMFAEHDQACAVCHANKAVLDLNGWTFEPCWSCQTDGWRLVFKKKPFWKG